MNRFLRSLIRFVLEYVVLPVVLLFGLVLLSTSLAVLCVTFALVGLAWCWHMLRAPSHERRALGSRKPSRKATGKAGSSRSRATRPKSASATQQSPNHSRRGRRASYARKTTGPSPDDELDADQTSHFVHIDPVKEHWRAMRRHFEDEHVGHEFHHAWERERYDSSRSYGMGWSSPFPDRGLMRDAEWDSSTLREQELGAWMRGDPPFDHDRDWPKHDT